MSEEARLPDNDVAELAERLVNPHQNPIRLSYDELCALVGSETKGKRDQLGDELSRAHPEFLFFVEQIEGCFQDGREKKGLSRVWAESP